MDIKTFLAEQESIGFRLINVRAWSMDKAEQWFKDNYEDKYDYNDLYEQTNEKGEWTLREEFQDIFWAEVDNFETELAEYESAFYEG